MLRRKAINENTAEKTTYANASTATVRKRKWRTKPNCCGNLDILLKWRTNPNQDTAHKQRNDCDQLSNYVNVQNANTRTTNSVLMLSTRVDFYNSNLFPPGGHAQWLCLSRSSGTLDNSPSSCNCNVVSCHRISCQPPQLCSMAGSQMSQLTEHSSSTSQSVILAVGHSVLFSPSQRCAKSSWHMS